MTDKVKSYIIDNWDKTIKENHSDNSDGLIGLPKPYTVPCVSDTFQEMYYWDTYFTNVGLILSDMATQAKNNADNMIHLVNRFGKMPNGNRVVFLNRSQPPFLSQIVREVFETDKDIDWLKNEAYPALCTEYSFWLEQRTDSVGLACYGGTFANEDDMLSFAKYFCSRAGIAEPNDMGLLKEYAYSCVALCESGWDFSSRFLFDAHTSYAIDLNSLLYLFETNMKYFADMLKKPDEAEIWNLRSEKRKELINRFLWDDKRKIFCDANSKSGLKNNMFSVASIYPMFAKLATAEQSRHTVENLHLLECEYGLASCENKGDLNNLQWDYPHGWACLHYITVEGLLNYGYKAEAYRIAEKYVKTVNVNFAKTQNLWEKYNVVTGEVSITSEYETPPMMGWSAGIYLYCLKLINER